MSHSLLFKTRNVKLKIIKKMMIHYDDIYYFIMKYRLY